MIDLHMHTNFSDGEDTVEELLINCEKEKLSVISITDHNSVKAYEKMKELDVSKLFKGQIINGVELDAIIDDKAVEILIYDFDMDKMKGWIGNRYKPKPERQTIVFNELVKKCNEHKISLGNDLSWDNTKEYAHAAIYRMYMSQEENRSKPELQFETFGDFYRISSTERTHPLYVNLTIAFASIEEVIENAKAANGKIFLAHLFEYNIDDKEKFLNELFNKYLVDGLEVYHYNYTNEQIAWIIDYCKKNNLLMSGGSDYHGENARDTKLRIGNGNYEISEDLISDWFSLYK